MSSGGCQCGAIRYEIDGAPLHSALCHCVDCRKSAGAPMVGWIMVAKDQLRVTGTPSSYASSANAVRQFCPTCGTGLFYINETILPGMVDILSATLDDASAYPPTGHIQWADALPWMAEAHDLPRFDRYPEG